MNDPSSSALDRISVVLVEPQNDINIGSVVRACKNFGVSTLKLVNPLTANPSRILVSAPKASDLIDRIERYDTLDEALAGCSLALAMTARSRRTKRLYIEPRGAAADIIEAARRGEQVALLFGREDSGLPNEALDRCHALVTIPTDPSYTSLNLAQAVLLLLWEVRRAATDAPIERLDAHLVTPESGEALATQQDLERMITHAERLLDRVGFLKHDSREHMMSTLREFYRRSALDEREVAIWHGIFSQIEWGLNHPERLAERDASS